MAVRDWPRPLRRTIYWAVFVATTAIAFAPLLLLAQSVQSLNVTDTVGPSWSQLLGGYATMITVPIVVVIVAITASHQSAQSFPSFLLAYVMLGALEGVFVGLVLSLVTGGYALLSAPAAGYLTSATFWLIRRPDRDAPPNPPTSAP